MSDFRKDCSVFLILTVVSALFYSLYTHHIWEDYFITFRHSQNLCQGQGLLYNAGEKIHGFTSPIGVLLPAFCYWIIGSDSYLPALWLFRIFCIVALMAACYFLMLNFKDPQYRFQRLLIAVFLILDVKAIAFSVNGMETAFMLLFLAWFIYLLHDLEKKWLSAGICWGLLMWTRPDSCVYIFGLGVGSLLFCDNRSTRFTTLLKIAGVCTLIYLPWFVGAFLYYGSPVPHTIAAKSPISWDHFLYLATNFYWLLPQRIAVVFEPIYSSLGPWPQWIFIFPYVIGIFASIYWIFPNKDSWIRIVSFSFFVLGLYLCYIPLLGPWYLPPIAMCGFIVFVKGSFDIAQKLQNFKYSFQTVRFIHILAIAWLFSTFQMVSWQMKIQQRHIEEANRKEIGLWLKDNIKPEEKVYLECLGYIGYFSGAHMLDNPGLVTPKVVKLRKYGYSFVAIIRELKPDWIVMRPSEAYLITKEPEIHRYLSNEYKIVQVFDQTYQLDHYSFLPGKSYLQFDAIFMIMQRRQ